MAGTLAAGLGVAAAALAARQGGALWAARAAAPAAAKKFYEGGFEGTMTQREASLILVRPGSRAPRLDLRPARACLQRLRLRGPPRPAPPHAPCASHDGSPRSCPLGGVGSPRFHRLPRGCRRAYPRGSHALTRAGGRAGGRAASARDRA